MIQIRVRLATINDVKQFVHLVNRYPFDIDLVSGRYVVDAKSIMGIFSLDLSQPILVKVHSDEAEELLSALEVYRSED